ncbi:MAG TPA: hypothetical protein VF101_15770 [Gaiellaceae bacterium]
MGTLLAAYLSVRMGAEIGFGLVLLVTLFMASVLGFLVAPHVMFALTIPLFALIPAAKLFVSPKVGPVKDLVSLAAIIAAAAVFSVERRPGRRHVLPDNKVLVAVAFILGLYMVNVGGGHDIAWAQGVRLIGEPLLLLVAGFILVDPRRTLRYAIPSLVATACFEATYGLFQQVVGPWWLRGWGYSFAHQLRTYNGHLRSFGTFDETFAYTAFLLFGLVAVIFWMRRGPLAAACGTLLTAGIVVGFVRTAILIFVALVGLWIGRKGNLTSALLVVAAAIAAAFAILVTSAGGSETTKYESRSSSLTLNGRTSAWKAALGDPSTWPLGRGVGIVGTAAQRAEVSLAPGASSGTQARAVDSGYLATIADVGFIGLAVLLALLGRLIGLATAAIRARRDAGWFALGLITVIMIDAVTRASFTGFPTAFLALPLIGVALASAKQIDRLEARDPTLRLRR